MSSIWPQRLSVFDSVRRSGVSHVHFSHSTPTSSVYWSTSRACRPTWRRCSASSPWSFLRRWRLRGTDPSARRFVRRSTQYAPLAKTCAHRGSNLRSNPAVVATEGPGAEVLWRRLGARHRSEHQATPEIYPLCRELLPHRPVRRSSLGGGWRRLVRRAPWPRGSWRFRSECRSAEWFHQLRTVPRCWQHFLWSRTVSVRDLDS